MNSKTDYTALKAAILEHAKKNFGDGIFTVIHMNEIADQQGVKRHHIKTALKQLVIEKAIVKVGATAKVCRGGSPANNFRLNKTAPKTAKTKREHQLIAAERIANMNTASLRLAKALGIPMDGQQEMTCKSYISTIEPQTKPLIGQSRSNVGLGGTLSDYMRETLTVPVLKLAARKHYQAYERATSEMSCGRYLAEHISGTAIKHKLAFNSTMDKLAGIDPSCPEFRL